MTEVYLYGLVAKFDGEKWSYPDKSTEDLLNLTIPNFEGSDPNINKTAADYVVDNFGGEIIKVDDMEYVPGRVY